MTLALDPIRTRARLPFAPLVAALRRAVAELADGTIVCPERTVVALQGRAALLSMPAAAADIAIHKLITIAPANASLGLPVLQGQVTVLDARDGRTLAALDGPTVTGRRTAALSMLAIDALATTRPSSVLLIGTGVQAGHHAEALAALHPEARVSVRGRTIDAAQVFARTHPNVTVAGAAAQRVHDVVVTCTTSVDPVHRAAAQRGVLVIAVGSFQPGTAEIAASTVLGSALVVDELEGARHEAGDLLRAGIDWSAVATLADVLRGTFDDRGRPRLFKSVGCAAWDLAAARVALAGSC